MENKKVSEKRVYNDERVFGDIVKDLWTRKSNEVLKCFIEKMDGITKKKLTLNHSWEILTYHCTDR